MGDSFKTACTYTFLKIETYLAIYPYLSIHTHTHTQEVKYPEPSLGRVTFCLWVTTPLGALVQIGCALWSKD